MSTESNLDDSKIEFSSFVKTLIIFGLYGRSCLINPIPILPVPPVIRIFLFLNSQKKWKMWLLMY